MTIDEAIAHERKSAKSNREAEALFLRDDFIWNAKEERKYAEEHEQLAEWLEDLQQYRAIGTVEEFNALKEKGIPKKVIRKPNYDMTHEEITCPICGKYISEYTNRNYCDCGQKLDWQRKQVIA